MNTTILLVWACIAIIGIIAIVIVRSYYEDKESEEVNFSSITSKNPFQGVLSGENRNENRRDLYESRDLSSDRLSYERDDYSRLNDEPIRYNEPQYERDFEPHYERDFEPAGRDFEPHYERGFEPVRNEFEPAYDRDFEPVVIEPEPQQEVEVVQQEIPRANPLTNNRNITYSSQNQVLVNYDDDNVEKFQEPITETQRDMMDGSRRMDETNRVTFRKASESNHELKDLFTIDELIEESKRKDDERERESKTINKKIDDNDDIKESIRRRKDFLEDASVENSDNVADIADAIKSSDDEEPLSQSVASQKEVNEAIESASNEISQNEEDTTQESSITEAVLNANESHEDKVETDRTVQETLTPVEEFTSPALKTPNKVESDGVSVLSSRDDYEFGAPVSSSNLFRDENGELSDLDYRKDLAKFRNTIKNSSIVKDIREKINTEDDYDQVNNDFIRNVNTYEEDTYEPIINETHVDYVASNDDDSLRQENTRKVFDMVKNSASEPEETSVTTLKEMPERSNLKIMINNNEEVLCKGDEIIYNYGGDTYSSKVYGINGREIRVKYRGEDIIIKESDVKKIY